MRTLEDIMKDVPKENKVDVPWDIENNKFRLIAKLTARCNFDFPFFCEHILGIKNLNEFHMEPTKYIYNEREILIIWPRGHLKTTIWSIAYPIWRLWRERGIEICIVSSALEQSQKIIEEIQKRIEDNDFLRELVPKNRQETWNKSQLNTENGNKCYHKPFNSTARGTHVDYLIPDDILREENLSQEQIKDYFWGIFYPAVQTRKGQILMVGTPMTTKDLFAEVSNMPDWKVIKKACVEVDDSGKWLRPIWDKRFNLDELQFMKEHMGSLRFEREYMCNPIGGGANIFKNIKIGTQSELNRALPSDDYYMGCDIAMQTGAKRDWLVFSVLGKDRKTGLIKQRKLERYQGWGEDRIIQRIKELHKIFNFKKIMIENIGMSVGLVKTLKGERELPVEGYQTDRKGKEGLISSISVGFETSALEILDNTIQYNELICFKAKEDDRTGKVTYEGVGEHDDTVIALGLAMAAIEIEKTGMVSFSII